MDCCHTQTKHTSEGAYYTCPMHPEIMEEQEGMCPECGMNLVPTNAEKKERAKHAGHSTNMFRIKFWISLVLTLPVIAYSDLARDLLGLTLPQFPGVEFLAPILGSIVFFYGGWVFLIGAWREIRGRLPGMMTLIAIAIVAAYAYSMAVVLLGLGEATLFWELTSLITIMLLGHWLEMRAVGGAQSALKELAKLLPDTADVIRGEKTETVSVEELKEGDVVLVRPGGKVPADGTIIEGASALDESVVTGESQPVDKKEGDEVVAGTINGDGSLKVCVNHIGDDTFLAGVMRLVQEAQASKSRLQILSDRAALYLTVVAVGVGVLAFGSWLLVGAGIVVAVTRLVTVLVIACPHALGLAVPLVASISTTKAAQSGFLIRDRLALEAARDIDIVLFDKTGTLTKGEFGVTSVQPIDDHTEDEVLQIAASLNNRSEHPLARAMVTEAHKRGIDMHNTSGFSRVPGKGVTGSVEGKKIVLGNDALIEENDIQRPVHDEIEQVASGGKTVVHLGVGGEYMGSITLADIIREESKETVDALHERGVRVAMITGDSDEVAAWVAKEIGIDEYQARVLPGDKAQVVKDMQQDGRKVAMVGDGINDAPALVQADLGIAIGAGTNVAIESAGIILVRDDPRDIPKIMRLSQMTYTKMIQNLWWAAGYNIVAIPLAAGVLAWAGIVLQPAVGAILMSASTVIVAFNAVLLRKREI